MGGITKGIKGFTQRTRLNMGRGKSSGNSSLRGPGSMSPAARRMQNIFSGFSSLLSLGPNGGPSQAQSLLGDINSSTLQLAQQFGPKFQRLQQRLIRNDPILGKRQQLAKRALNQQTSLLNQLQRVVSNPNQLDPATARLLTDQIRSRFSSQGSLDSGGAALGEVTGLVNANMNATDQRIGQLLQGLSGNMAVASGGIGTTPNIQGRFDPFSVGGAPGQGITGSIPGIVSGANQQMLQQGSQQFQSNQALGQGAGQLAGMALPNLFPGLLSGAGRITGIFD